jgi:hypothetical protein
MTGLMNKKTIRIFLGVLALGMLVMFPGLNKKTATHKTLPCSQVGLECGNATLRVKVDGPISLLKAFTLNVYIPASEKVHQVYADFTMQGMSMGLNRYRLIPSSDGEGWHGDIMLPACVAGRTNWHLQLALSSDRGEVDYLIPFSVDKRSP